MTPWIIALCAVLLAAAVIGYDRYRVSRTMHTLDRMLDDAIGGTFAASRFDESRLSAIEAKMQRYLEARGTSKAQLAEQKAHVQALIADVSHQTKRRSPIFCFMLNCWATSPCPRTAATACRHCPHRRRNCVS